MTEEEIVELEEEGAAPRARPRIELFNLLAGCVVVLALLVCGCAALIYFNPYIPLNPFKPPTATATPGPTATITATPPRPTRTPLASPTARPEPTRAASPAPSTPLTPQATVAARFMAEISASPQTLAGRTCEDNSIAGEVKDVSKSALIGYTIEVSRVDGFKRSVVSGSRTEYGPSGWEVLLVNDRGTPEPLHSAYTVRLFDPMGVEVANPIPPSPQTTTSNNCVEGVIYIIFQEITGGQ